MGQALKGIAEILKDHVKTGNVQTTLRVYDEIIKETNKKPLASVEPQDREMKVFDFRKVINHTSMVSQRFDTKFVPRELQLNTTDVQITELVE